MFNKKKKEPEFDKKVSVNFNTFQINFSEEDKNDEFVKTLQDILNGLPNVQESYSKTSDNRYPTTDNDYINAYNHWLDCLIQASNIVMSILRKRPRMRTTGSHNDINRVNRVIITDNRIDVQ